MTLLLACSSAESATGPIRRERVAAQLLSPAFALPDSLERGTPLTVRVLSGGGGCHEVGGTDVRIEGLTAEITPFDYEYKNANCAAVVLQFDHVITLTFGDVGMATIRVYGHPGVQTKQLKIWRRTS